MANREYSELFDFMNGDFWIHFNNSNNNRILFSGKYGIGKTYFLRKFFKHFESTVFPVVLSPVHYSISNNEDIVRFIKYDILFSLLESGAKLGKIELTKVQYLSYFFKDNPKYIASLASPVVEMIPLVGKTLSGLVEKAVDMVDDFKEKYSNALNEIDETTSVTRYMESIDQSQLKPFVDDAVTVIIKGLLEQYSRQTRVLVIDDLDRVDPEHIFRILNIFAAHLDSRDSTNKYGFEKVLIVCDIDNIRSIFHQKYGAKTDFTGYVDKFYSSTVYKYDPFDHFETILKTRVHNEYRNGHDIYGNLGVADATLFHVSLVLNKGRKLDLRNILSEIKVKEISSSHRVLTRRSVYSSSDYHLKIVASFRLAVQLLGESGELIECLELIEDTSIFKEVVQDVKYLKGMGEILADQNPGTETSITLELGGKLHVLTDTDIHPAVRSSMPQRNTISTDNCKELIIRTAKRLKDKGEID